MGCGDTELVVSSILEISEGAQQSRYTGVLYRVGTLEKFGLNVEDPEALEWNGTDLYMVAQHGRWTNESDYLFRVSRETGKATFVNPVRGILVELLRKDGLLLRFGMCDLLICHGILFKKNVWDLPCA